VTNAVRTDRPLNVALVSTQLGWRGGEVQAALLARGLIRRGQHCEVVARAGGELARRLAAEGVPVYTFPGRGRSPWGLWRVRAILDALAPDIVHANDSHALSAVGVATLGLPATAQVAARRVEFPVNSPSKYNRLADRVLCVSQRVQEVSQHAGIEEARLQLVYDGVDPARVANGSRRRGRERLEIAPNAKLLLSVGALDQSKGHADLLDALPAVVKQFPEVELAIAGAGAYSETLIRQAASLGLGDRVHWLGYREDVADLIHSADLFVHPSREEGLGSTLIDAMLAGVPIVTTTAGGILELVGPQNKESAVAWTSSPEDKKQLSDQIVDALSQPDLAKSRAEAAKERALERFTDDSMVESTLEVYHEVLSQEHSRLSPQMRALAAAGQLESSQRAKRESTARPQTTAPAVSVVMPIYNGAQYLREALASIRWQTFTDWELVCVNDGSTDESLKILRQFAAIDSRIRIVNQENQGIVEALNRGVEESRADWIARIDSDDVALPVRLATQWRYIQENPEVVLVGSHMLFVDPKGNPICIERYQTTHEGVEQALLGGKAGSFGHPSVLMRRDKVLEAGGYRKEFEWVEDTDLWLRMIRLGRVANIPQVLVNYRLHEQSVCWNRRALQRERGQQMLALARAERGLTSPNLPAGPSKPPRKQSSAAGKWARRAARAGYYRTAFIQWKSQVASDPFSLLTFRVTAEMLLRGTTALFKKREPLAPELPDWRDWDSQDSAPAESPQAA